MAASFTRCVVLSVVVATAGFNEASAQDTVLEQVDLEHILPANVQAILPSLLDKYGHPERQDPEVDSLIHHLVGDAGAFDEHVPLSVGALEHSIGIDPLRLISGPSFTNGTVDAAPSEVMPNADTFPSSKFWMDDEQAEELRTQGSANDTANAASIVDAIAYDRPPDHVFDMLRDDGVSEEPNSIEQSAGDTHLQRQAEQLRLQKEEFLASRKAHEEFMKKNAERTAAAKQRHAAARENHSRMRQHFEEILKTAHHELRKATNGFQDVPFWDDFFHNTSTVHQWGLLHLQHLQPALDAYQLQSDHRILVLEPSSQLGLAHRLVEGIRSGGPTDVSGATYSSMQEHAAANDPYDFVLELGLLDAIAMAGTTEGASRLAELRRAIGHLAGIVKPGGAWLSVSAVPPTLRLPLLERLAASAFTAPAQASDGVHTITLGDGESSSPAPAKPARLRGAVAGASDANRVANLLLYGDGNAHAFVYRLRHHDISESSVPDDATSLDELNGLIEAQRSGVREDL